MPGRNENELRIGVELELTNLQKIVNELKVQLQDSVKPDSKAYTEMNKFFDGLIRAADKLKISMDDAFSTSKGSKSFSQKLQGLEKDFEYVIQRFKNISGKDLIASDEDTEKLKDLYAEITNIQKVLSELNKNKIESFFPDKASKEFKSLEAAAKLMEVSLEGLTATKFGEKLASETERVTAAMRKAEVEAEKFKRIKDNLSLGSKESITSMLESTFSAGSDKMVNSSQTNEMFERVRQFLTQYQDILKIKPERLSLSKYFKDDTANLEAIINGQTNVISQAIIKQIEEITTKRASLEQAFATLKDANNQNKPLPEGETKQSILASVRNSLGSLMPEIENEATLNVTQIIAQIKNKLLQAIQELNGNELKLNDLRDSYREAFQHIFDGIDTSSSISKVKEIKQRLQEILMANDIDIKDEGIGKVFENIEKGANASNILDQLSEAILKFSTNASGNWDSAEQQIREYKEELKTLDEATASMNNAQSQSEATIEEYKNRIEELERSVAELRKQLEETNKTKIGNIVPENTSGQLEEARKAIDKNTESLGKMEQKTNALNNIQSAVTHWMGFTQVLNLTKRAVKSMISHMTELDKVMTQIAVVTNMTQQDLWNQMGTYSAIAQKYGVAIKGVYEVSQIFYQQGLQTADVMKLSEETLKMARIAGIDYAAAADYMTTAVRGFKMEMSEANNVTDVFSALAAHTASDTEELAVAMSKTASSLESVGASFEASSAMIATMVSVTRESATNIGSALKSIAARYGEMKSDPTKLVDSEGEEMSLNKVDTALKSIGISIQDANHQFRDFDDVILELGEKWNTLDKNAQRYIATVMA